MGRRPWIRIMDYWAGFGPDLWIVGLGAGAGPGSWMNNYAIRDCELDCLLHCLVAAVGGRRGPGTTAPARGDQSSHTRAAAAAATAAAAVSALRASRAVS